MSSLSLRLAEKRYNLSWRWRPVVQSEVVRHSSDRNSGFPHVNHHGLQVFPTASDHYLGWFNTHAKKRSTPRTSQVREDSACLGINGNEAYGKSYESLSALTGGIIGSVCEANYGSQLSEMGKGVCDLTKSYSLECLPVDKDGNGAAWY